MQDRYLYRAKRIFDGKWAEGFLTKINRQLHIVNQSGENAANQIDESTVCQCTGLKDKHGKLIWENDIVWDSEEREFYQIIFSQEDMCYYMQDADGYKDVFEACYGSSIEVESNIFDNPELLE